MKHLQSLVFILLILINTSTTVAQNVKEDPNLQAAFQAHGALKLTEAKSYFETVAQNREASKKDRCEALRQLALLEWKHYRNYNTSINLLKQADSIGDYKSETHLVLLRVEEESKNFEKALIAGDKAIELAKSKGDKNYSKYKFSKVVLSHATSQFLANNPINNQLVTKAKLLLEEVLNTNPTNVNAADVLFGLSLLQKDGANALKSWLAYYRFNTPESAYKYLQPTAIKLNRLLNKWNSETLTNSEETELIKAIGSSRFYKYVNILAKHFNSKATPIIEYANYMKDMEALTNNYYRLVSIDKADSGDFLNSIRLKNEAFYNTITSDSDTPFEPNNFRDLLREKFGTVLIVSSSSASRQVGLVFGHIVNERIRNIEQYGHSADFTFTELDMMISNGYPSWFWEDRGAGGYALRGGFLRIKTMFKYLAISAWEKVTDSVKRQKIEQSIQANLLESDLQTDIKVIRAAVAKKIELDALDALYKKLVSKGYNGIELQLKFIEQYELYRDNATMFAHEGRHSIDRVVLGDQYRALGSKLIEYRGRLSQIAFSESPKLELANMLSGVSSTPTGQSNKMIIDVIENWIINNVKSITDYNTKQLPLAQIYKLTDAQIISAIQAVDPFYIDFIKN